ncbi:acyl-CoA-6-aminopenicillanic acid acyltransferase [Mesorhizobium loti]|nr:acyl-CoA-6-aminopenicillanic acid acyltransferase [Mesorhizobium loti]
MTRPSLPVMALRGTPYERGHQHGAAFERDIVSALDRLAKTFPARTLRTARRAAEASWRTMTVLAPAIAAEIEGMADGARCAVEDIFLNIGFEFFGQPSPTGCSALAFNSGSRAVVGQNWDAPRGAKSDLVLFIHTGPDGFRLATVASRGTLGWVGQNGPGLCLVTNDLMLDTATAGLPSQVVRRMILSEPDIVGALRLMPRLPHMGGRTYLLGDASGRIAGVEVSPKAGVKILGDDGPLFHTNHALLSQTRAVENRALLRQVYPSTHDRYASLAGAAGSLNSVADAMRVLRNRAGAPNAVAKSYSREEATETACSIVCDPAAGVMHVCLGLPRIGAFVAHSLASNGTVRRRSAPISSAARADTQQTLPQVHPRSPRSRQDARPGSRSRSLRG